MLKNHLSNEVEQHKYFGKELTFPPMPCNFPMLQVLSHINYCCEAFCDTKGMQKRYAGVDTLIKKKIQ